MEFNIITAFPNSFSALRESIVKRATDSGVVKINIVDLKKYGLGKWQKIDDKPYGGGPGMILQVEPIFNAIKSLGIDPQKEKRKNHTIVLTSASGELWDQTKASEFSKLNTPITIICGHYEGVDHRVVENIIDKQISIGNFVLSGGEIAAQVMVDSVVRLLPGVLGNPESLNEESHSGNIQKEYPQYTRPESFEPPGGGSWEVPKLLLSGDHKKIQDWKSNSVN